MAVDKPWTFTFAGEGVSARAARTRLSTKMIAHATSALNEVTAVTRVSGRMSIAWIVADGAELEVVLPDLTGVAGFGPAWAVTKTDAIITATAHGKSEPLGDGTIERFASHSFERVAP